MRPPAVHATSALPRRSVIVLVLVAGCVWVPWKPAEDAACTAYIRQCLDHLDEYDSLSKELRFVQAETALDHAEKANALAQAHCSDPSSMKIVTAFARVIAVSRGELKADREHYKLNSAQ